MASADFDFTERERTLMSYAWQCFEEQPKIDFAKLASSVGMSNPRSATNAWAGIKKKLNAQASSAASTVPDNGESPTTPTASRKRRGDDGSAKSTPAKKGRTPKKARATGKDEEEVELRERMIKAEPGVIEEDIEEDVGVTFTGTLESPPLRYPGAVAHMPGLAHCV